MRIGMAQMDISWENIEDNKKKQKSFSEGSGESGGLYRISGNDTDRVFNECGRNRRKSKRNKVRFFEEMSRSTRC